MFIYYECNNKTKHSKSSKAYASKRANALRQIGKRLARERACLTQLAELQKNSEYKYASLSPIIPLGGMLDRNH